MYWEKAKNVLGSGICSGSASLPFWWRPLKAAATRHIKAAGPLQPSNRGRCIQWRACWICCAAPSETTTPAVDLIQVSTVKNMLRKTSLNECCVKVNSCSFSLKTMEVGVFLLADSLQHLLYSSLEADPPEGCTLGPFLFSLHTNLCNLRQANNNKTPTKQNVKFNESTVEKVLPEVLHRHS